MNLTTSAIGTAVGLSTDLRTGVIDRFRTLPIWKPSVLVGRSLTDLLSAALCAAIVIATGFVVGWRPDASLGSTLAGVGIFLLFSYALSWGCACLGLVSQDAESAQGLGLIILFPLAFVSNALVPTAHMPAVAADDRQLEPGQRRHHGGASAVRQPEPVGGDPRLADAAPGGSHRCCGRWPCSRCSRRWRARCIAGARPTRKSPPRDVHIPTGRHPG